jgi:hypothetical protein
MVLLRVLGDLYALTWGRAASGTQWSSMFCRVSLTGRCACVQFYGYPCLSMCVHVAPPTQPASQHKAEITWLQGLLFCTCTSPDSKPKLIKNLVWQSRSIRLLLAHLPHHSPINIYRRSRTNTQAVVLFWTLDGTHGPRSAAQDSPEHNYFTVLV